METTKNKFGLLHSLDDKPSLIDNGDLYWHKDGKLHGDNDLPSIIMANGDKYWHIYGIPSRLDISLPYIEKSDGYKEYRLENGGKRIFSNLREKWLDKNNRLNRENGPAVIEYYKNRNIQYEDYFINGEYHREDGPAVIEYYENGNIKSEEYYLYEQLHREDGPSYIKYYENGNVEYERYFLNGNPHRENGPANISYYENGNVEYERYFLNGIQYSKEDYLEKIKEINFCNKKP
jgi:antitoxin component YwqK of YwqJK toxin-antitoxin module